MASANRPWDYEVFLSFRGEDTRKGFTSHLYAALVRKGIVAFIDDGGLRRGEDIAPELLKAIEKSRCAIVILSQNYSDSKWCLRELVKIMECRKAMGLLVFPIFYHVDPSHVRNQTGSFGEAVFKHTSWLNRLNPSFLDEEAESWCEALSEVANLSGWDLRHRAEAEAIEDIANTILTPLRHKLLPVDKNLVGVDDRLEEIIPEMIDFSSNDVRMIGIYGLGGIGKTTIAKAVYNKIASRFMIARFIADVREEINIDEGIQMMKERLCFKKVLLVLDDVDSLDQLEALAGDRNWFGPESRIIVTTRDKHLLELHKMDTLYEARKLDEGEAVELFSRHAFEQKHPKEDYEKLTYSVVRYADGLPLGLKVLGRFLFGKTICQWESEVQKLEREPKQEIHGVLKRSYDELDRTEKEIFLDIACFFNGEDKDRVTRILDACKFYARSGIRVLSDKCLITIFDNKIWMHDLLQKMGRDIVQQECPKDPEKWSRLCYPNDANRVLTRKLGTGAIEGILFDVSEQNRIRITTESFEMMKKLRLLKIYWAHESASMGDAKYKVKLSTDFKFPSYELRYLHWHGYPLESLPSSFDAEDLVELDMSYSSLKQLWESGSFLEKLNTVRASYSQHLMELPDFSDSAPNLEKLILDGCSSLVEVHPSIGRLNKLIILNLKDCKKLSSFPSIVDMEALAILNLSGCSELKEFPDIQGNMRHLLELHLASTAIEELPSSIGDITRLVLLDLKSCKNLKSLPPSICRLISLEYLFLSGCSKLENFPEIMEDMNNLRQLLLDGSSIEVLPSSIERLKGLVLLDLRNCKNLVSLPNRVGNLRYLQTLILSGCSQLGQLPKNIGSLQCLVQLHADGTAITQPPDSIVLLKNLQVLIYPGCKILPSSLLSSFFSFWLLHRNRSNGIGLRLPSFPSLTSLTKLNLSGNNFLSIPTRLSSELTNLRQLQLGQSQNLTEIPELPPSVRHMDAHDCTSSISMLQWLQLLFSYCSKPVEDQSRGVRKRNELVSFSGSEPSLASLAVAKKKIFENVAFSVILPGSGIPNWILNQSVGSSVRIKLPADWYDGELLGFAVCSVLEHLPDRIICQLSSDELDYGDIREFGDDSQWENSNACSEHVWLGYQPCAQLRMFQMINGPNEWSHIEISFEATSSRVSSRESNLVKKCGVRLIYAGDLDSIQRCPPLGSLCDHRQSSVGSSEQSTNDSKLKLKGNCVYL